jgi:hypothetical protein
MDSEWTMADLVQNMVIQEQNTANKEWIQLTRMDCCGKVWRAGMAGNKGQEQGGQEGRKTRG